MSKLTIDLRLIERAGRALENDYSPTAMKEKNELKLLSERIKQITSTSEYSDQCATDLLAKHMDTNLQTFVAICDELVEEIISHVSKVCEFYQNIKNQRDFTTEEKAIGKELSQLLRATLELLGE